jgi:hypothetical protein
MPETPFFATSREALTFAINFQGEGIKQPTMTRMMSEMQKADKEQQAITQRRSVNTMRGLSQLDKSAQAGLILQLFGRLPDPVIHLLLCSVMRPRDMCNCRRPCCSGFSTNKEWLDALRQVDASVYTFQNTTKIPGKKGFITPAPLRAEIVRQFFDRASKQTQEQMAEKLNLHEATIGQHQKVIGKHLLGLVRDGFTELDVILVEAGIVGATE